mgnify:CR=1 FL=1
MVNLDSHDPEIEKPVSIWRKADDKGAYIDK